MGDERSRTDVEVEDLALPVGSRGRIMVRIFRPAKAEGALQAVLYLPDPAAMDEELARELARIAGVAVLVPDDEAAQRIEASHELLRWIVAEGARRRLDGNRVAVMGDGLAAELALRAQVPLWPGPTRPAP